MPDADSTARKRVDEDWKERVDREQSQPAPAAASVPDAAPTPAAAPAASDSALEPAGTPETGPVEARFDVFVSGLSMEALIGLGDLPHPMTKKRGVNLPQAKYLIDLLGILEEKTRGNLTAEEAQLLQDVLYQLRMRYLGKTEKT